MWHSDGSKNNAKGIFGAFAASVWEEDVCAFLKPIRSRKIGWKERRMKLVIPYIGALQPADSRLMLLADFLGIQTNILALSKGEGNESLNACVSEDTVCIVVNPNVIRDWVPNDQYLPDLVDMLVASFSHVLVHGVRPDPFHASVVSAFSGHRLGGVRQIERASATYQISPDSKDVCEAFAGLDVGPVNPDNDRVFLATDRQATRRFISIEGDAFMAAVKLKNCNVIFIGSEDVVDLTVEVGDTAVNEYFSRLLPQAMALRYMSGEECWRPNPKSHACVIVDDPLLRPTYGFLNFEDLLGLMQHHNFHTTIAFIPHNFRRSSPRIIRMFRENPKHLSLCFHGNDHTGAELAATDPVSLNTMLQIAAKRMTRHGDITGLDCDRVMVFPQGKFSVEAMSLLRSNNFDCAVNTVPHPMNVPTRLTLGELAQPAVVRYGQFPLFLRKDSTRTERADIAFNLFFGRPTLIVEHHNVFEHPQRLLEAVSRINETNPETHWTSVGRAAKDSMLQLRTKDGATRIRAYTREVQISNSYEHNRRVVIEWRGFGNDKTVDQVLKNGKPCRSVKLNGLENVELSDELDPTTSATFGLIHKNNFTARNGLGFRSAVRGFVRRRLSEARDNYLSKNPSVLAFAKSLQRRCSIGPLRVVD